MTDRRDPMSELKAGFFAECAERIEQLQDALVTFGESVGGGGTVDPEVINTAFRAIHSIKGGAGAFGLDALVRFAHGLESVFDLVRGEQADLTSWQINDLMRASDHLADLIDAARDGITAPPGGDDILGTLSAPASAIMPALEASPLTGPWTLRFRPHTALYASGNDALFPLLALRELGATEIRCDVAALPDLAALDPEEAYLGWTLTVSAERNETEIAELFDFVIGLCDLAILRKPPTTNAITDAPRTQASETSPTMRVDLERIDRLMNVVGELAIGQSILAQSLAEIGLDRQSQLAERLDTLTGLTRDLQDSVMTIRAQPVKPLFQRMGRVLRETSAALGKPARLVLEGETTEVDRTVIERLSDPLMHMIRNAVDHGLESPSARLASQKPSEGTITLAAAHRAGRLVIELHDDGRGLDRNRIRAKAEDRGLISKGDILSGTAIDELIFHPGLSTCESLSNVSGRGVGMDVVKTAISRLGGRISIASEPGWGTRFTLSLPLTLAVMDGMVVSVTGQMLVIPIAAILETAALRTLDRRAAGYDDELVRIRGAFAKLIDVSAALGIRRPGHLPDNAIAVLTASEDGSRAALIVDAVIDQRQIVVKSLRGGFGSIPGISAATILGDGQIAFICDPGELARTLPVDRIQPVTVEDRKCQMPAR